jgi:hypothetical protein
MLTSPSPFKSSVRNLTRIGHVLGLENVIEGFLGDPLLLQSELLDAPARLDVFFGDGHRFLIAKHGVGHGHFIVHYLDGVCHRNYSLTSLVSLLGGRFPQDFLLLELRADEILE